MKWIKWIRKEGIPTLLSILIFFVAEGIKTFVNIPSDQWKNVEVIFNILMIMVVAVSFFQWGMPSRNTGSSNPESVLSNVLISVFSFPMNIDVFGHTIHLGHIFSDLWGWHIFWIICVIMQIVFLSRLGENLLNQIRDLLKWIKKIIIAIGNFIFGIVHGLEEGGKIAGVIIILGMVLWGIYLYSGIRDSGIYVVFSDKSFLWGSIQLWLICFFIYIIVSVIRNVKGIFNKEKIKKALAVVGGIILLVVFIYIFPKIQEVLMGLLKMLVFPVCSLLLSVAPTVRSAKKRRIKAKEEGISYKPEIKISDLVTVIFSFVWVPLNIIYISTYVFHGGGIILTTQDLTNFNTWMDFWKAMLEAINSLLQLMNIS